MALVVQRGGLRFKDAAELWDAVRAGDISIEDDVIDESSPLATPVKVADVEPPRASIAGRPINGWYVLGGMMATAFVLNYVDLPGIVQLLLMGVFVVLGLMRLFDRSRPVLPRGWENVFRRRR